MKSSFDILVLAHEMFPIVAPKKHNLTLTQAPGYPENAYMVKLVLNLWIDDVCESFILDDSDMELPPQAILDSIVQLRDSRDLPPSRR